MCDLFQCVITGAASTTLCSSTDRAYFLKTRCRRQDPHPHQVLVFSDTLWGVMLTLHPSRQLLAEIASQTVRRAGMPFGYYKTKTYRPGHCVAWASTKRLNSESTVTEESAVHVEFGQTEEDAANAVCAEMDAEYGPHRWWRCT